jgi:hypothetical protein
MRDVKGRWKGRLFTNLSQAEDLCDLDNLVAAAFEIFQCDRTVAGAKINSETETRAHGNGYVLLGSAYGISRLGGGVVEWWSGGGNANHLISTSAGAIAGRRSVTTIRGSLTNSVFQPLWSSVPVNGGSPVSFPTSRY